MATVIQQLGRLEKVDLRDVWPNEAKDFTPWLALESNIALLGEALGMELEIEAQEKGVGPFCADILCKDVATDRWVLVENQLERTNHVHLGQLLTYAAGLEAVTIVWLAAHFTEEHRAALDWLNDITEERFNFFGLEVELWKIGGSAIAPKFNVVSKPNDWTRTIHEAATQLGGNSLSATKRLQLDFWTKFRQFADERGSVIRPTKPFPQHWMSMSIGRSGFHLTAVCSFWRTAPDRFAPHEIRAEFICDGRGAKEYFGRLHVLRNDIEREFGEPLCWHNPPDVKSWKAYVLKPTDVSDVERWPECHHWLLTKLERLRDVFAPRVKMLGPPTARVGD
jgi:hypothetical protein